MTRGSPMLERVQALLTRLQYKPGTGWRVSEAAGMVFLQHWQHLPDTENYVPTYSQQRGRKFYLSEHMVDEEILQTALLAVLLFEEHEARECLRFDGTKLFGPHKALAALLQAAEARRT